MKDTPWLNKTLTSPVNDSESTRHDSQPANQSMTSHQFAKQLLKGHDLPIFVPAVAEYDDSDESAKTPIVTKIPGERTDTDEPCDMLMISYEPNAIGKTRANAAPDLLEALEKLANDAIAKAKKITN